MRSMRAQPRAAGGGESTDPARRAGSSIQACVSRPGRSQSTSLAKRGESRRPERSEARRHQSIEGEAASRAVTSSTRPARSMGGPACYLPSISVRGLRSRPSPGARGEAARAGTWQTKARLQAEPLPHPPAQTDLSGGLACYHPSPRLNPSRRRRRGSEAP